MSQQSVRKAQDWMVFDVPSPYGGSLLTFQVTLAITCGVEEGKQVGVPWRKVGRAWCWQLVSARAFWDHSGPCLGGHVRLSFCSLYRKTPWGAQAFLSQHGLQGQSWAELNSQAASLNMSFFLFIKTESECVKLLIKMLHQYEEEIIFFPVDLFPQPFSQTTWIL